MSGRIATASPKTAASPASPPSATASNATARRREARKPSASWSTTTWLRQPASIRPVYARQPDNVYLSYAPHAKRAGLECRRCHGDHGLSAATPVYQFNRISTYSRNIWGPRIAGRPQRVDLMKMSDCVKCHAERGVRDHCLMCHK